jgi:signal transduction histidine kinase
MRCDGTFSAIQQNPEDRDALYLHPHRKGGRDFLYSVYYQKDRGQLVVALHDITETKRLADKKKELIANASQELRIPLTSIKGYIETLDDHMDAEGREYLAILKRNVDRLSSIVQDLMTISELDFPTELKDKDKVDVEALLALQQPMSVDLPFITSAMRSSVELERIADHATNIGEDVMGKTIKHHFEANDA